MKSKFTDYDGFVEKFVPKKTTDECAEVRKLDGDGGKSLFGLGFILSEQARADKEAAEAEADRRVRERAGSSEAGETIPMSSRERAVVDFLTQHSGRNND